MKTRPSPKPHVVSKNKAKPKSLPALNFILVAVKKVGGVFASLFGRNRKTDPDKVGEDNVRFRKPSCKFDVSSSIFVFFFSMFDPGFRKIIA